MRKFFATTSTGQLPTKMQTTSLSERASYTRQMLHTYLVYGSLSGKKCYKRVNNVSPTSSSSDNGPMPAIVKGLTGEKRCSTFSTCSWVTASMDSLSS